MGGGGLECVYGGGGQPENQEHHQWECESRVATTGVGAGAGRGGPGAVFPSQALVNLPSLLV